MSLFESVPNFSEGRRREVVEAFEESARRAYLLDAHPDPDHNRVVVSVAGGAAKLTEALLGAIAEAVKRIDLKKHAGVHPRVGAADVVPIIPLAEATLDESRELARAIGRRVWSELRLPVYFYGHGEGRNLAEIRAGRVPLSLGGPDLHPTAGAVCLGARRALVAFNLILYQVDLVAARAIARAIRERGDGLRGVQALVFELPGNRVQLSMNLFRLDETTPADVMGELERRGVAFGAPEIVGLCPATAAIPAADGRLFEARLAAAAATEGAVRCEAMSGEEGATLGARLHWEASELARLPAGQDAFLGAAERSAALVRVLEAAKVLDAELHWMLETAARGFRAAVTPATEAVYKARIDALDARL